MFVNTGLGESMVTAVAVLALTCAGWGGIGGYVLPWMRLSWLAEILASIPIGQNRTSVKKCQKVIEELCLMALTLPGARHLSSHM